MPALDSLRVLAVCVRHGNFSRAASELGITPTAVSQRVRALEAQIGVELFRRSGPPPGATLVDVSAAVAYLASEDARHVTGSKLIVDGSVIMD